MQNSLETYNIMHEYNADYNREFSLCPSFDFVKTKPKFLQITALNSNSYTQGNHTLLFPLKNSVLDIYIFYCWLYFTWFDFTYNIIINDYYCIR